jgi:hypothetical protein
MDQNELPDAAILENIERENNQPRPRTELANRRHTAKVECKKECSEYINLEILIGLSDGKVKEKQ